MRAGALLREDGCLFDAPWAVVAKPAGFSTSAAIGKSMSLEVMVQIPVARGKDRLNPCAVLGPDEAARRPDERIDSRDRGS